MPDFVVRIFKSWNVVDEENYWVNNYEFMSDEGTILDAGPRAIADSLVAAERAIHLPGVKFFKFTISTWANDTPVYDPSKFVSVPLNVSGQRNVTGDALDANVCFFVKKEVAGGRYGKLFYRGCLVEGDVQTRGDLSYELTSGSTIATGGTAWNAYLAEMNSVIGGLVPGGEFAMIGRVKGVSGNPGPVYKRAVLAVTAAGVTINDTNHKWYNRSVG